MLRNLKRTKWKSKFQRKVATWEETQKAIEKNWRALRKIRTLEENTIKKIIIIELSKNEDRF